MKERLDNVHFETKKDYAAAVLQTKYPAFFFKYYDKKVNSPEEWLWGLTNGRILENLGRLDG